MIVSKPKKKNKTSRFMVFNVIMFIIFGIITAKLLFLQVYRNDEYEERADMASTRFVSEQAPRGKIYDAEGNILASNRQTYTLTYTKTTTADESFYETMDSMFKILEQNGEEYIDDLLLKLNSNGEFYFGFKTDDKEAQNAVELRFKKDRGFEDDIKKDLFEDKKGDYSDKELKVINSELLKITPEDTFYNLVKLYNMYELILPEIPDDATKEEKKAYSELIKKYNNMEGKEITELLLEKYSLQQIRNYMVIKDTVKIQGMQGTRSATIASNIEKNTADIFYQKLNDLPGIDVKRTPVRDYPYGDLGSAVLGYVSSINGEYAKQYELRGYDISTDLIGMSGIESAFEEQLKGKKGGSTIKVNSTGRETEKLFELETYPGNNVHLTLDKDIQYAAQQSLEDTMLSLQQGSPGKPAQKSATRGAAIALEVKTGRLLALASYPDFDPNLFAIPGELSDEDSRKYFNPDLEAFGNEFIAKMGLTGSKTVDDLFPIDEKTGLRRDIKDLYPKTFYNYATQGAIQPGSTFKPLTSVAGLEEGVITTTETINDLGAYKAHPEVFGSEFAPECMIYSTSRGTHGAVDIRKALQVSCNYYYYETAFRLYEKNNFSVEALDSIAEYAWQFGLGYDPESQAKKGTGIEIYEELGQSYNFKSFKESVVNLSMFDLVSELESGTYAGGYYTFVPFDFGKNEFDNDKVKEAKERIKAVIRETLGLAGTKIDDTAKYDEVYKRVSKDIKIIMENSDKYKKNVSDYEASKNTTVNLDKEVDSIARAIANFSVYDKFSEISSPAQLIYASIGQSTNVFTPLQMAQYIATLANGGTRYKLRLVDEITSPTGEVVQKFENEILNQVSIKPENLQAIKEGMALVNKGNVFANYPITSGGKTGTADFSNNQNEFGRDPYATYVGFAPLEDPEIAVFTVIYDAGKGSYGIEPAMAMFDAYFKDRILEIDPNYGSKSASFRKYVLESPIKDNKPGSVTSDGNAVENPATKPEDGVEATE